MRILVTGSRDWTDALTVSVALENEAYAGTMGNPGEPIIVVHGAARGLDSIAARLTGSLGLAAEAHPADWDRHGKKAGVLRNQEMVDAGADVCLAFPLPGSVGTYDCMRRAKEAGIPVLVFKPKTDASSPAGGTE